MFGVSRGPGVELENSIEFLKNALSVSLTFTNVKTCCLEPRRDPSSDVLSSSMLTSYPYSILDLPGESFSTLAGGLGLGWGLCLL